LIRYDQIEPVRSCLEGIQGLNAFCRYSHSVAKTFQHLFAGIDQLSLGNLFFKATSLMPDRPPASPWPWALPLSVRRTALSARMGTAPFRRGFSTAL